MTTLTKKGATLCEKQAQIFLASKYTTDMLRQFPLGTLLVNVTGSFVLAFISYSVLNGKDISPEFRSFATIGFIGAYRQCRHSLMKPCDFSIKVNTVILH